MVSRRWAILCVGVCIGGIGCLGLSFLGLGLGAHAEAQSHGYDPVDRQYQELAHTSDPLIIGGQRLAKIAKLVMPSVVHIQSVRSGERGGQVEETGSGVIMSDPNVTGLFVVTNRHVVADAKQSNISIHLHDARVISPTRVWTDEATDVAVLLLDATDVQAARWGDSNSLEIGHMVLAVGSPFGLSQSITLGIVSAKSRRSLKLGEGSSVLNQDFLQTDAAINPGNSGGPLIDLNGNVIAINTAIASSSGGNDGIGFSIPINLVRKVTDQLLQYGRVRRAYLGVKLDPNFDSSTARRLKLGRIRGARVLEVYPNTPASQAQLRFDDVILKVGGTLVQDENHLINLVSLTPIGHRLQMEIVRNGQNQTIEVLLADRDELSQRSTQPASNRKTGQTRPQVRPQSLRLYRLGPELSHQIGFGETARGLIVMQIDDAHPLAESLRLYDVIVEAARQPVTSLSDWEQIIATNNESSLLLRVRRVNGAHVEERLVLWEAGTAESDCTPATVDL